MIGIRKYALVLAVLLIGAVGLTVGVYGASDDPSPGPAEHAIEIRINITVDIIGTDVETTEVVSEADYELYEVTAYTAGYESTGKTPDHPLYGITASGEYVRENHTLACPKSLPFGTRVEIPYFNNVFTCEDRGGAITDGKLDVFIPNLDEARAFGRRVLDVKILSVESEGEESE